MSNPVHHLILTRLDATPAPTVSFRELSSHDEHFWRPLIAEGVLVEGDMPEEITVAPARTLSVKKIGAAYYGYDASEEFPAPQRLSREDVIVFRVVVSGFVAHIRSINAVDGRSPSTATSPIGLHLIGRKSAQGGMASVWFATALGSPDAAIGYLATLAQDVASNLHIVVFPVWPDVPLTAAAALSSRGVYTADLDPASLSIRWPREFTTTAAPSVPEYGLIFEGASWRIHFLGDTFTIPHKTGVVYLGRLLDDPTNIWTPLEVQRGYRTQAPKQAAQPEDGTQISESMETPLRAATGQDMARLRKLTAPLRLQLAEAERTGDAASEREARAALAKLIQGTNQISGRNYRSRVSGADEKARKNVSKQINEVLAVIEDTRASVGRHIREHLTPGQSMTYSPPRGEVWRVDFPK